MLRVAVVVASALLVSQAHADYRRFCAPQGQCFVCPRGQPACEVSYALSRAMTPPASMDRMVPPSPVPSPGPPPGGSSVGRGAAASVAGAVEAGDH